MKHQALRMFIAMPSEPAVCHKIQRHLPNIKTDWMRLWANRQVGSLGATDRPSLSSKDVSLRDLLIPNTSAQPAGSTQVYPGHGISLTSYSRRPYFLSYHSLPCSLLLPDQAKASCHPSVSLGIKVEYRLSPTWVETASES